MGIQYALAMGMKVLAIVAPDDKVLEGVCENLVGELFFCF